MIKGIRRAAAAKQARRTALGAALLGIFAMAGAARAMRANAAPPPAGQQNNPPMSFNLEGKIINKHPGRLTVNSGANMIFHVLYNAQTAITRADGSSGTDADLKPGVSIRVKGDLTMQGDVIAKKITIEPAPSPQPPQHPKDPAQARPR